MRKNKALPVVSLVILALIGLACAFAGIVAPYAPGAMDSAATNVAPCPAHLFGTDNMGRDLFTMVLYGGRASLIIGLASAVISTFIAVVYGTAAGLAGEHVDDFLMRAAELFMSLPSILVILFLQAWWGEPTYLSLSVIIGVTSWMNISKIIRSEVRQIGESDYILAARTMGGGFWYILRRHLLPNYVSSIMFMVVSNISAAIITESTLSFLGLGLPLSEVSWGSLLSMSEEALLSNYWWIIVIPGVVLITTLVCITNVGEYIRKANNRLYSNL